MGSFRVGGEVAHFDDEVIAQLRAVVQEKLHARQSFAVTWLRAVSAGSGRVSVWVHPSVAPIFAFSGVPPRLDRVWTLALLRAANSPEGLVVVDALGRLVTDASPEVTVRPAAADS